MNAFLYLHQLNTAAELYRKGTSGPEAYYYPRIFIWEPQSLGIKISCPRCNTTNVTMHQWTRTGRRVVDINDCFVIVTRILLCKNCEAQRNSQVERGDEGSKVC